MLCLAREINSHVQQLRVGVKGLVGHLSDLISVFFLVRYGDYGLRLRINMLLRMIKTT